MKRILRYLVTGVFVAILFLVATVAIFLALFDANAYKQDMSDLVREHSGRDLQFHGDVELTIYPALGMKLGAMSFSNAPGFGAQPMVKVKQASISVDVASLVRLEPEIEKLVLRDLEVNLVKNKVGVTNWDDLLQKAAAASTGPATSESAGQPAAQPVEQPTAEAEFEVKGAFGGLDLRNIRLSWTDQQAGEKYQVTDLDISTGRIVPNKAFPMTLHLEASAGKGVDVSFDFKSSVEYLIEQQRLTLSKMSLALNEFQIGGSLQLSEFANPTPTLRFDLASKNLDVDALLGTPPAQPPGPEAPEQEDAAAGEDVQIALPMQLLRDLDIDGKIRIAKLKAQNMHLSDIDITINAQQGLVGLKPLKLNAYDGRIESSVVIDVNSDTPEYAIDKSLKSVQVGKLLKDFTGEETISGDFNADAHLTTSGEWLSELKKNLNGRMKLAFLDGALNGFNIRHSIDEAKAKISGKEPPAKEMLRTDFSSLSLSGAIRKGVFRSDDLDLQAPLLRVGGKGRANLVRETVDYTVVAKLVGSVEGQQGQAADKLSGLEIPVKIKGPFTSPEINVLLDDMLKDRLDAEKAKLKAELEARKKALKKELEAEKKALKKELEAEKKALEESVKRELEQKKKVARQKLKKKKKKAEAAARKKKQQAEDEAREKLEDELNKLID